MAWPRSLLLFVAAGLALAGCGRQAERPSTVLGTPAPRLAAPFTGEVLTVTEAGAGPITRDTPFSAEAIAALFPDAEVTTADLTRSGRTIPVIRVRQTELLLTIESSADEPVIAAVHAGGENARGPNGEQLHQTGGPARFTPDQCPVDPAATALSAVCRRTPDSHVSLVFTVGDFGRPSNAASPYDQLVAHGFLADIVWERSPSV